MRNLRNLVRPCAPAVVRSVSGRPHAGKTTTLPSRRNPTNWWGCHNQKRVIVDTRSGKVVATLPVGKGVDGCAFDPERGLAFSPNGEGTRAR